MQENCNAAIKTAGTKTLLRQPFVFFQICHKIIFFIRPTTFSNSTIILTLFHDYRLVNKTEDYFSFSFINAIVLSFTSYLEDGVSNTMF
jgi:hypothetical protein